MAWDYLTSEAEALLAVQEIKEYVKTTPQSKLALDLEGYSRLEEEFPRALYLPDGNWLCEVTLMQIGADPRHWDKQWIFDIRELGKEFITNNLKDVLENTTLLGHNLKFDVGHLITQFNIWPKKMRDTMLISQILNAGDKFPHTLSGLYKKYFHYGWFISETARSINFPNLDSFINLSRSIKNEISIEILNFIDEGQGELSLVLDYFGMWKLRKTTGEVLAWTETKDPEQAYEYFLNKFKVGMNFEQYNEFKKKMQVSDWSQKLTIEQKQYAADDVRLIFFLYSKILEELDKFVAKNGKKGIYEVIKLECDLITEFALMEIRGLDFDKNYHQEKVIKYLQEKSKDAIQKVGKFFSRKVEKNNGKRGKAREVWLEEEPININSPAQIKLALEEAGLTPLNTSEDELKRVRSELPELSPYREAITALLQAKKAESLLSKFGEKMINLTWHDGKIHPQIHQMGSEFNGVVTGRSSGSNPNIMQIPMRDLLFGEVKAGDLFRKAFVAPDGYKVIAMDYSQIEPRCTAQVTKDKALLEEFQKEDVDLHALTAKALLSLSEAPKKGTYEREYIGKTANLAMSYGIGATKLAKFMYDETIDNEKPVNWSIEEAREALKKYYVMFEGVKIAMNHMSDKVSANIGPYGSLEPFKNRGTLFTEFTLMGRPRRWFLTELQEKMAKENPKRLRAGHLEPPTSDEFGNIIKRQNEYDRTLNRIAREAYNFRIQGTCADILKKAVLRIRTRLLEMGFDPLKEGIIAVIHDEILCRVREDRAEEVKQMMSDIMIETAQQFIKLIPVKVGGGIAGNWADAKS